MRHKTLSVFDAGVQLPAGAASGRALISDGSGNGTWQALTVVGSGTLLTGSGAPSGATGSDGAMYLDTTTGRFYGPKAAGVWPAAVYRLMPLVPTYAQLASG